MKKINEMEEIKMEELKMVTGGACDCVEFPPMSFDRPPVGPVFRPPFPPDEFSRIR
ncbi:MAG: hypothetical protein K6F87_02260 [Lachnospiraceae bacterium]|nr:hypothetical protein [Lachnospiraceae bacterium]